MKTRVDATFKLAGWDEKTLHEFPTGDKINLASVKKSYEGSLTGAGVLEYVMSYLPSGSATFVGLEHVTGRLDGRAGAFLLQHAGTYGADGFASTCSVLPNSGTGELAGLQGEITFSPERQEKIYPIVFTYEFTAVT